MTASCMPYVAASAQTDLSADDDLKQTFGKFGTITETRVFRQQGYAFVKYDQKESAANAIFNTNNTEINGCHVKCSWGKESGASTVSFIAVLDPEIARNRTLVRMHY